MGPAPPTGAPGLGTVPPRYLPAVQRDAAAVSLAAGFRPRAGHRLAGTLVFRHVDADPFSGVPGTATTLLSLHYTADLGARWTLGGSVRRFDQDVARTTVHGAGVEVGWMALRDVWLVSGYNVAGFSAAASRTPAAPIAASSVLCASSSTRRRCRPGAICAWTSRDPYPFLL
jgi:hypothetical protein